MEGGIVQLLVKVMLTTFVLMGVIMLCCIVTPRLAKWIDAHRPRREDSPDSADPNAPTVQGPFDKSSDPDYDLNYKIYHKDIYGVDFKHGKEKNG
ncbi:MAG: hypothetical protein K6B74_04815 [Ruminococcus sp.]|nr:hypothetical protein [Ruminococcus sp.]